MSLPSSIAFLNKLSCNRSGLSLPTISWYPHHLDRHYLSQLWGKIPKKKKLTHFEIVNTVFNMFSIHFNLETLKHLHSNCNWAYPKNCVNSYLRTQHNSKLLALKVWKIWEVQFWNVMNHVENCVQNFKVCWKHVENFKACWKCV